MDRWIDGPMDRWADGPMDRWMALQLSYFLFAVCAWWLRLDMTAVALSDVQLSRRLPSDSTDGS